MKFGSGARADCGNDVGGRARPDATLAVAWQLARESDRAAADWLRALPPSPDRDAAFAGVAGNWANHDPDAAMTWAPAQENPTLARQWTALIRDADVRNRVQTGVH